MTVVLLRFQNGFVLAIMDIQDTLAAHPCVHSAIADATAEAFARYHTSPAQLEVSGNVADSRLEVAWTAWDRRIGTTFQRPRIAEDGAIGVACMVLAAYTDKRVTEVAKRRERADYYVGRADGDKREMLEVSGTDEGDLQRPGPRGW